MSLQQFILGFNIFKCETENSVIQIQHSQSKIQFSILIPDSTVSAIILCLFPYILILFQHCIQNRLSPKLENLALHD